MGGSYGQRAAWREGGDHLNTVPPAVLEQMGFVQAKEDMERVEEGKGTTGGHSLIFQTSWKKTERLRNRKEEEKIEQAKGIYKFWMILAKRLQQQATYWSQPLSNRIKQGSDMAGNWN